MNLVGTINEGYTIIKQGKKAVIAHNSKVPNPYVAWSYNIISNPKKPSYFWGKYGSTKEYAEIFFNNKEE